MRRIIDLLFVALVAILVLGCVNSIIDTSATDGDIEDAENDGSEDGDADALVDGDDDIDSDFDSEKPYIDPILDIEAISLDQGGQMSTETYQFNYRITPIGGATRSRGRSFQMDLY